MNGQVKEVSAEYNISNSHESESPVTTGECPVGYKQTEVGVIPDDWDSVKIENVIAEISMGPFGSDIKVSNFVSEGVPVLSGSNIQTVRLVDGFKNYVTKEKAKSLKKAVASRGDIVVTHRGTLGQVAFISNNSMYEKYVISQSQFRARFRENVNPNWVALYFLSEKGARLLLEGKGHTGVPAIAQATTTFRKLYLPLPPLKEQTAIANALSDVDALITLLEKLITKKRAIKTAAMQQLLTGKKRLPPFDKTHTGYKQSELGEIPEDWEVVELGELGCFKNGVNKDGDSFGFGSPFVNLMDVFGKNSIKGGESFGLINSTALDRKEYDIKSGDVLFIRSSVKPSGVGLTAVALTDLIDTIYSGFLIRFRSKSILDTNFKKFCFYESSFRKRVIASSSVSANTNINQESLKNLLLAYPTQIDEQSAIATVLSDMDKEIETLNIRLNKTQLVKQGMMQQLLTGRTRLL